ncbi:MAG: PH domain-containing protein [Ilumatobacter sp.]
MIDLTHPQRQSPFAIVFLGLRILRSLGIAQFAIVLLFIVRAPFSGPFGLVMIGLILAFGAFSIAAWWRYTFHVVDGELVVIRGVIRIVRLNVPIERIQSITIEQRLLHRLTGLVKVSVDTAGSDAVEFSIDAVSRDVAEALQHRTATASHAPPRAASAPNELGDRVVFSHGPRRLLLVALTTPPLTGLFVLGSFFALPDAAVERFGNIGLEPAAFRWWWLPVGVAAFLTASVVLNIVRVLLRDWNLTLSTTPTGIQRTSGLLSRTKIASNVDRIQLVTSAQNPLERRAAISGVRLTTAGHGVVTLSGCDDQQFSTTARLAGVTPLDALVLDRRLHPAVVFLAVRNVTLTCVVLAAGASLLIGWWTLVLVLAVPWTWAKKRVEVANFRWALRPELATSSRIISSSTEQALLHKANAVRVTQSIFERRRGLGRVHMATAAGAIEIGMIPIDEAHAVRDTILHAVETDARPWI